MSSSPTPLSRRRFLALGVGAGAVLLAGGVAFQEIARVPGRLSARDRRLIDALAVTLYPGNPGPPGDTVGVADFVDRYVQEGLEPTMARVLRGLFFALEWGAVAGAGGRFTSLSPARRTACLRAMEEGGAPALRSAVFGLKSIVNLAYFDHPAVRDAVGMDLVCEGAG